MTQNNRFSIRIVWISCFLILISSCSTRKIIVNEMTLMVESGISEIEKQTTLSLTEQGLPGNIQLLEVMLANDPSNQRLKVLLARLYGSYAFAFLETRWESMENSPEKNELKKSIDALYLKSHEMASQVLFARYSVCQESLKKPVTAVDCWNRVSKDDVPVLFWMGFSLGAYVNINLNSVKALSRLYIVESVFKKVIEYEPSYFYGSSHLFLMAYYASRPASLGGSLDKSLAHYKEIKKINSFPFYLADVYYARYCLTQQQDRKQFVSVLQAITSNETLANDPVALYNQIAIRRANLYLTLQQRYFE